MKGIGNGESTESDGIHTHDDEEDGNEEDPVSQRASAKLP